MDSQSGSVRVKVVKFTLFTQPRGTTIYSEVPNVESFGRREVGTVADLRTARIAVFEKLMQPGDLLVENGRYFLYLENNNKNSN